jgi:hypothetical protein
MMQTNRASTIGAALAPPLRVQADMPAIWKNIKTDFDSAASLLVEEHKNDGTAIDLPVLDLATWGMVPIEGQSLPLDGTSARSCCGRTPSRS